MVFRKLLISMWGGWKKENTVKFRKWVQRLIFFKGLFEGLIFGGGYLWREICVSKSIGLAFEGNWPFLLYFSLYILGQFPSTSPRGAYIRRGDLTEGFLRYEFGALIFGGAYFSEFYGILPDQEPRSTTLPSPLRSKGVAPKGSFFHERNIIPRSW